MATSSADALSGEGLREKCETGPPDSVSVPAPNNEGKETGEFKAGRWEFTILGSMALLNIILAVDATILPPALPVGCLFDAPFLCDVSFYSNWADGDARHWPRA